MSRAKARCAVRYEATALGEDGDGRDGVLDQERAVHRPDSGQLGGLVVAEQGRCVLRREEMVGERVAHGRAGHWCGTFSWQVRVRPTVVAITVSGCHLILVICGLR